MALSDERGTEGGDDCKGNQEHVEQTQGRTPKARKVQGKERDEEKAAGRRL